MPAQTGLTWTPLGIKQAVMFFDPNNPDTSFAIPQLNPQSETIQTGDVRKYTQTTNATSVIIGKREYPPQEITLNWNQIDISDYIAIAQLGNISPLVYVDSNGNGYLGVLQIYSSGQLAGMTSNVWTCQMNFLVLSAYSGTGPATGGLINPLTQFGNTGPVLNPSLSLTPNPSGYSGFIPSGTTLHLWITCQTIWGESLATSHVTHTFSSGNNNVLQVTWAEPTNNYFRYSRLYWYTANTSSAATMLTEYQKGFADGSGNDNFYVYTPYVSYNTVNPPVFGGAYCGYWSGGLWINDPTAGGTGA